jgi:glyceraldehyde 3-phosphate dehydrogenase (phosphorylating)
MTIRVGINGFGRIGRNFFRAAKKMGADIDFVAVNDLGSVATMAHLLEYDSVHGRLPYRVRATRNGISVDGDTLRVLSERNPEDLPWGDLGVDVVIESTGIFTSKEAAGRHRKAGAPKVIISAPSGDADATFVVGVNDSTYNPDRHHIISNASCTTNCFVPMMKVLDDAFGVQDGLMTTIHGYTGDQSLVDGPHKDLRRARAAAINIVPTSTGAARATGLVMKKLQGRLDGIAMRVPVPDGSLTDFVGIIRKSATAEQINAAFKAAASRGPLAKVLDYSEEPLVSTDIVGSPASCTFDAGLTMSQGTLVKICGWYDNEWGYSSRMVDLTMIVGRAKASARKSSPRKASPRKATAAAAKSSSVVTAAAKKAPAKKATAKKATAKKATAKKATAKKATAKKATAKKATAKKATAKKR